MSTVVDWPLLALVAVAGAVLGLLVALFTEELDRPRSDSEQQ